MEAACFAAVAAAGTTWTLTRRWLVTKAGGIPSGASARRRERKAERYARAVDRRRAKGREKRRQLADLKRRAREEGTDGMTEEEAAQLQSNAARSSRERRSEATELEALVAGSRLTILVNCAYDCNTARERQSLAHQLMGVYAANKRNRSRSPAQVVVWLPAPEVEGKLRDKGAGNWPAFRIVPREGAAATDAAAAAATAAEAAAASEAAAAAAAGVVVGDAGVKDRAAAAAADGVQGAAALAGSEWVRESPGRVVILTPDSEVELDRVEDGDVFVIGGIVDRSVRRGQTLRTALDLGVRHARLPIARALASEGEELAVGSVLNVDTVAEAIMRRKAGDEWPAILSELVPKRIRAKAAKKPAKKRGEGKDTDGGEWEDADA
ncbi:hypothetical protein FNF27_00493 [Cafeteria roenbergensis]|uniref:tRNA (guanine(9)-N(1))-methyltransferase n=1 Tax=Cafeteria roenbergensis TaxID=33653 RepID=A0A5A8EJ87_CAFRO|nr:hypothetical protein FNF29_00200 [Cafeteria roenbergensis]KAA0165531.1 hypothetical protein FNF31_01876 [Cafeteria roenbergensis]KAA0172043.1 hypothetical protein FNF28_00360 [Cafeteria roenbergensis]KAA0177945.1 hypothetical protein FNF27_00493 [Cafeteria roenbergensis]|eukprot:KAA0157624.1 hypothetical protein FNF29_00200 [Cafeteria roenbergensis]